MHLLNIYRTNFSVGKTIIVRVLSIGLIGTLSFASYGQHTDEQETPDLLLHETQREDVKEYGESNIVIQTGGKKVDEQITPDKLEESLAENKKITEKPVRFKTSTKKPNKEKELKKKVKKKKLHDEKDQLTADPLLDSVD
ncbi:hypothetical protein [Agarilytica rhodophyticola]|uniref:hypothetical protein n=1 Tax=Agarilytica rhodophyticola TaxID=1737490 RepID=UPI000B34420C|nr:hypothetical protein [Agarilytica rhodophyticola]